MEHWIESARTHLVTVVLQLLDHAQTKNRLFACVVQNVYANQAREELPVANTRYLGQRHNSDIEVRYRKPII
jgi:hypothetical protein